jgi:hypothetical protein
MMQMGTIKKLREKNINHTHPTRTRKKYGIHSQEDGSHLYKTVSSDFPLKIE